MDLIKSLEILEDIVSVINIFSCNSSVDMLCRLQSGLFIDRSCNSSSCFNRVIKSQFTEVLLNGMFLTN